MNNLDILRDDRVDCYSVMTTDTTERYLSLVQEAYKKRGGIEGQRETLKTNTAIRIRRTMIEDLKSGAILPPVVLGIVVSPEIFKKIPQTDPDSFEKVLKETSKENIFIIDGMQRTSALLVVLPPFSGDRVM